MIFLLHIFTTVSIVIFFPYLSSSHYTSHLIPQLSFFSSVLFLYNRNYYPFKANSDHSKLPRPTGYSSIYPTILYQKLTFRNAESGAQLIHTPTPQSLATRVACKFDEWEWFLTFNQAIMIENQTGKKNQCVFKSNHLC